MIAKMDPKVKPAQGLALPDHFNPAKQPSGSLKNDHEAGAVVRQGPGRPDLFPVGANSEDLELMNAVIGNPDN